MTASRALDKGLINRPIQRLMQDLSFSSPSDDDSCFKVRKGGDLLAAHKEMWRRLLFCLAVLLHLPGTNVIMVFVKLSTFYQHAFLIWPNKPFAPAGGYVLHWYSLCAAFRATWFEQLALCRDTGYFHETLAKTLRLWRALKTT
jgi:hypothetical protein